MDNDGLTQYTRIAISLAERIASGQLKEGDKISGRSKLSPEYNVSPETIRRALRLLADGKIPVRTCVLDAAITPYRAPRWLTRGFSLRNYLVIRFAQRHLALIRRAFPSQRFGQAAVEDVCMILGRMDRRDVWRVFDSCFYYPLPKQLCTAARVSYWYGEKEYSQRALDIRHVRRLLPEAVFVPFPDCAHAEFVSGQPEAFAARLAETLERD